MTEEKTTRELGLTRRTGVCKVELNGLPRHRYRLIDGLTEGDANTGSVGTVSPLACAVAPPYGDRYLIRPKVNYLILDLQIRQLYSQHYTFRPFPV